MADSTFQIVVNPASEVACAFPGFLFNEPFFIQKQPCQEKFTFYLIHVKKQQAYARCSLFKQGVKGISPCRGTFGAIEMHPHLPVAQLDRFIRYIDAYCAKSGIDQIEMKAYPFCYQPDVSAILTASLLRLQYWVEYAEVNYNIPITEAEFTDSMHVSEKRRLNKCLKKGFTVGEDKEPDFLFIYQLIVQSRMRKGYPVSMQYEDFRLLFEDFPGVYKIFTVKDQASVIAATVAVQINQQILYYFLPAHDPLYNTYSPMVLLIKGLYDYCQQQRFRVLDLGISTDKGVPNDGLMRFKQNMGAHSSLKPFFVKKLSAH